MARVNWPKAIAKFNKDHAETGIKLKAWCDKHAIVYNSMRRSLNAYRKENGIKKGDQLKGKITKKDQETNSNDDQCDQVISESDHQSNDHQKNHDDNNQQVTEDDDYFTEKKPAKQTGKLKRGAQPGNQSAKIHGFFTKHFKEKWELAACFDQEVRTQVINAQAIEALESKGRYQDDLEKLQRDIYGRVPTEDEYERMGSIGKKIESCDRLITGLMKMGSSMELDTINMAYIRTSDLHKKVDIRLKERNIELADANTSKARAQTNLSIAQLKALDKDEGGSKDDLDDILDDIMEERDGLMSGMPEVYDDE